jgi:hypothetical protein
MYAFFAKGHPDLSFGHGHDTIDLFGLSLSLLLL